MSGIYIPQGSLVIKTTGIPTTPEGNFDLNFISDVLEKYQHEKGRSIKIKVREPIANYTVPTLFLQMLVF